MFFHKQFKGLGTDISILSSWQSDSEWSRAILKMLHSYAWKQNIIKVSTRLKLRAQFFLISTVIVAMVVLTIITA